MGGYETSVVAFVIFGLTSQVALAAYFAARRWAPRAGIRYGWLVYAFSGLGLPLGVWLLVDGQSWRLYVGPILLAMWAALGAAVDLWRRIEWRTPVKWGVFVPYVGLYFWAQMFLWWPLWDLWRAAWFAFLPLFVVNTTLNIRGHLGRDDASSGSEQHSQIQSP